MKFSVLIPTRNRLEYLKYAIASTLRQGNQNDVEIVISDNASEEDIKGYVHSLNEPCIKYSRSPEFISVTENWNRCLDLSSGDYIIMLGDDDILLKDYFKIASNLIENFQHPDLIYTNAFLYAYPGVLPNFPKGVFNSFGSLHAMPKKEFPFFLELSSRIEIIKKMLKFEAAFGTNMQHALVHRSLIEKVKKNEKFFYSPYPDFYAMSALFLTSEKTLIYPKELVVIGVTPKSHGYYFYNNKEKEGLNFLKIEKELSSISTLQSILIPVPGSMLSFWLGALEVLKIHFPLEKYGLKLDYKIYRNLQIQTVVGNVLTRKNEFRMALKEMMKHLSLFEKLTLVWPKIYYFEVKKLLPSFFKKSVRRVLQLCQNFLRSPAPIQKVELVGSPVLNSPENKYMTALEIYEQVKPIDCSNRI